MNLKRKIQEGAVKTIEKLAIRQAKREMGNLNEKHMEFIKQIQMECAEVLELEDDQKAMSLSAIIIASILQGFDTQREMELTLEMAKTTIDEYWKQKDIPQKQDF